MYQTVCESCRNPKWFYSNFYVWEKWKKKSRHFKVFYFLIQFFSYIYVLSHFILNVLFLFQQYFYRKTKQKRRSVRARVKTTLTIQGINSFISCSNFYVKGTVHKGSHANMVMFRTPFCVDSATMQINNYYKSHWRKFNRSAEDTNLLSLLLSNRPLSHKTQQHFQKLQVSIIWESSLN